MLPRVGDVVRYDFSKGSFSNYSGVILIKITKVDLVYPKRVMFDVLSEPADFMLGNANEWWGAHMFEESYYGEWSAKEYRVKDLLTKWERLQSETL